MKKILIAIIISVLLVLGGFNSVSATNIREGDVIVWKSFYFEFLGYNFPTILFEILHQTQLFTHVDYVGENEILYTSIQDQGSSISNVNSRLKYFYEGVILRDDSLDYMTIRAISESARNENVDYDYLKNYGIALDSLFWGNENRFFGQFGFYPYMLACSGAVAKWFEENGVPHSVRDAEVSSPSDIFYWEDWEVAGTFG